jgi:prophage tail gpP-like protein
MGPELVTVSIGGMIYSAFREVKVTAALDHAARSFEMAIAAAGGAAATAWAFAPGTSISIAANGDPLITGYVDRYQPKMDKNGREVKVSGRSKAQDFIDCAATAPGAGAHFSNKNVLEIAQALDQFGVGVTSDQELDPLDDYQVTQGETAFEAVEKICRSQGLTLTGTTGGGISLTKAGTVRHAGGLFEGVNIIDGSADLNWAHRHSQVTVIGQKASGTGAAAMQVSASSGDSAVSRFRPATVVLDDNTDDDSAQERADYRIAREAGESLQASVEVQGFRDDAGTLWTPGNLVWLQSDFLGITQVMLIKGVAFVQSRDGGSMSFIDLIDPQAFGGKAGKGGSAKDPWNTHASRLKPS